jgi:hypothetical protein
MDFYGVAIFWTRVDEQLGFMQSSSGPWSRKPSPSIATHRIVGPRPGFRVGGAVRGQVCRLLVEQSGEPGVLRLADLPRRPQRPTPTEPQ